MEYSLPVSLFKELERINITERVPIQSARFVLINGFSFAINNQLYQYIDKYGGAFDLARAEPTHLSDVKVYTAMRRSMQILRRTGSMICSGIRKPGKYTCRFLLIELDDLHSGLLLCPDYTFRQNH